MKPTTKDLANRLWLRCHDYTLDEAVERISDRLALDDATDLSRVKMLAADLGDLARSLEQALFEEQTRTDGLMLFVETT